MRLAAAPREREEKNRGDREPGTGRRRTSGDRSDPPAFRLASRVPVWQANCSSARVGRAVLPTLRTILLFASAGAAAAQPTGVGRLEGLVVAGDRPVAGARILSQDGASLGTTATDGRFAIPVAASRPVLLRIVAEGFAERDVRWDGDDPIRVELQPASFADAVTVSADRVPVRIRDTAASVVVLSEEDFATSATTAVDATLRQVPGFTLFRRSDSRTANPTTQGASLRGLGGSGTSRALVLDDGVPLNDPFGGWVAWGRVIETSLDRVEVLRGGASDRYGAPALSGVIQMVPRAASRSALTAEASYGSARAGDAQAFAALVDDAWSGRVSASAFRTDGFVLLPEDTAGPVDVPANSRFANADAAVQRSADSSQFFLRGAYYAEDRGNGTPLQVNDTRLWQVSAGADGVARENAAWTVRAYGLQENYHQTFSAVSPDRSEETLTRVQDVPSWAAGVSGQWETTRGAHRLLAGVEGRVVGGESDELVGETGDSFVDAGGRQATGAVFVQDRIAATSRLSVTLGLRYDGWRNFDAFHRRGETGEPGAETPLEDRSASAWSPRAAIVYAASPFLSLTGSVYRSFRAPTLNELYRDFRVGNALTLANDRLGPEALVGGEAGALVSAASGRFAGRATLFWSEIDDAIVNVTLTTTPSLITRERQNLGLIRARGVEADLEARIAAWLSASAGYLYVDSSVIRAADLSVVGRRTPQVPRHQLSATLRTQYGPAQLALQVRYGAPQFEDDRNALRLAGFVTWEAWVGWELTHAVEAFVAGENLTDQRIVTGRTPLPNLGPPRQFRGGVRLRLD